MADDKYALCSAALALVGADGITSFEDGTTEANAAARLYEPLVRQVLSRQRWHFAKTTRSLGAALADAPQESDEFAYAFQIPTEPAVLDVHTVLSMGRPVEYAIEGDKVFCNVESGLSIRYTWRPDEGRWPDWFGWLVTVETAAAFAEAFDRTEKAAQLRKPGPGGAIYDARMDALRANLQSATTKPLVKGRLIANRMQ